MSLQELRTLIKHLGMIDEDMRRLYAEKATNSMSAQAVVRAALTLWVKAFFFSRCRGARAATHEQRLCYGLAFFLTVVARELRLASLGTEGYAGRDGALRRMQVFI
jgi:hypothetical protein